MNLLISVRTVKLFQLCETFSLEEGCHFVQRFLDELSVKDCSPERST